MDIEIQESEPGFVAEQFQELIHELVRVDLKILFHDVDSTVDPSTSLMILLTSSILL
jgi:hypothetical protein